MILRHPDHIHTPIRPDAVRVRLDEGPPPETDACWLAFWRGAVAPVLAASGTAEEAS